MIGRILSPISTWWARERLCAARAIQVARLKAELRGVRAELELAQSERDHYRQEAAQLDAQAEIHKRELRLSAKLVEYCEARVEAGIAEQAARKMQAGQDSQGPISLY